METEKYTMEDVQNWLGKQIDELAEDGFYVIRPCGYDDYISERTVLEKFNEYIEKELYKAYTTFGGYLAEWLAEQFWDADIPLFDEIDGNAENMGDEFKELYDKMLEDGYREGMEEIGGYRGIYFKLEEFLDHDYHINLMFATKNELNYDMGAITDYYIDPERLTFDDPSKDKRYDNALTYLIKQQGYTENQIKEAYEKMNDAWETFLKTGLEQPSPDIEDKFIKSVGEELLNYTYGISELTALVSLNGQDLIDVLDQIASKKGSLEIPKEATIGLYNEWHGACSQLGIELVKPFIVPSSMVRNVQIEKAGKDLNRGYTVDDTCGLISSCWKEGCKAIKENEKQIER